MIKKIALTTTLAGSVLGTGLHYLSHGYVALERYTVNRVNTAYANTIEGLAKDYGFVKPPPPLEEQTRLDILKRECKVNKVPYSLARAVMKHESNDNEYATSHAGAMGLMQVMPFHIKTCGYKHVSELYDEEKNIVCGVRILSLALKNQRNNVILALKEYNGGANGIDKSDENRKYPHLVLSKLE